MVSQFRADPRGVAWRYLHRCAHAFGLHSRQGQLGSARLSRRPGRQTSAAAVSKLRRCHRRSKAQLEETRTISTPSLRWRSRSPRGVVSVRVAKETKVRNLRRGNPFEARAFARQPVRLPVRRRDDEDKKAARWSSPVRCTGASFSVVIDEKGLILTNNHVVGEADDIRPVHSMAKELAARSSAPTRAPIWR